jgi:hypothetical protein
MIGRILILSALLIALALFYAVVIIELLQWWGGTI